MPENKTPEGKNPSNPEGESGLSISTRVRLQQLKNKNREETNAREWIKKKEAELDESKKEQNRELLRGHELRRVRNTTQQGFLILDLSDPKQLLTHGMLKSIKELHTEAMDERAQKDPAFAQFMDAFKGARSLYEENILTNKTGDRHQKLAAAMVAMEEILSNAKVRLENREKSPEGENIWLRMQQRIPLGSSVDHLAKTLTTPQKFQAKIEELTVRAKGVTITQKMIDLPKFLPDDQRAMAMSETFVDQFDRYKNVVKDGYRNDPEQLAQAEDALAWMELISLAFNRYADKHAKVKQFLDGTLEPAKQPAETVTSQEQSKKKKIDMSQMPAFETKLQEQNSRPERLDEHAGDLSTSDEAFQEWEDSWIDGDTNSYLSRVKKQYAAFRILRDEHTSDSLVVASSERLKALLNEYNRLQKKIPSLTGKTALAEDMRAIEDVLITIDDTLTSFESAWKKKKFPQDEPVNEQKEEEEGEEKPEESAQEVVDTTGEQIEANEAEGEKMASPQEVEQEVEDEPVSGVSIEKSATEVVDHFAAETPEQAETTEASRSISIPRTSAFQIEVRDTARKILHNASTVQPNVTKTSHGPVGIKAEGNEWKLTVPANFRGSMKIVQNGAERNYEYGADGASTIETAQPSAVETQASAPVQNEADTNAYVEYFQKPGGLNRFEKRTNILFSEYKEMIADEKIFGGSLEWKSYAHEAVQLLSRYQLALPNGNYPVDTQNRVELLKVADELEGLIADYKEAKNVWEEAPLKEADKPFDPATEKQSTTERLASFRKTYNEWDAKYNTKEQSAAVKEVWNSFNTEYRKYYNIYLRVNGRDNAMLAATLTQMERLLHYYGQAFENAKSNIEPEAKKGEEKKKSSWTDRLKETVSWTKKKVDEVKDSESVKEGIKDKLFYKGQSRFNIRQSLIFGAAHQEMPKLTEQEIESLLYIKAHLKRLTGSDGKFNAKDAAAISESIAQNVLSNPSALAETIYREKGMHPGTKEARGVRMALNLESRTADEESRLAQGRFMRDRPFLGFGKRLLAPLVGEGDWRNKLAQGENDIARVDQARWQIPFEVRQRTRGEIGGFMERSRMPSYSKEQDTGHGNLSKAEMEELQKHALVLKGVSERALKDVRDRTGAHIETYLPDGLSIEFIDAMLDSQTRFEGRMGTIPGSFFWITNAPVDRAVDRKKEEVPIANEPAPSTPTTNLGTAQE